MKISYGSLSACAFLSINKPSLEIDDYLIYPKYLTNHLPLTASAVIYFCADREIVYWNANTRLFGSLYGHGSPITSVVIGNSFLYSADKCFVFCWDVDTFTKLAQVPLANTLRLWVCDDILLVMLPRSLISYRTSRVGMSLLHTISLMSPLSLGTVVSGGVIHEGNTYTYFLIADARQLGPCHSRTYIWTLNNCGNQALPEADQPTNLKLDTVFPTFDRYVRQIDLPLLTDDEIKYQYASNVYTEENNIMQLPSTVEKSFLKSACNTFMITSSKTLPGSQQRDIIGAVVLKTGHILCVYRDALFLYTSTWSIVCHVELHNDIINVYHFYSPDEYLTVGLESGYVRIYECSSLLIVNDFNLRNSIATKGAVVFLGLLCVQDIPCILLALKRGEIMLLDILTLSIKPCLSFTMPPVFLAPLQGLGIIASGTDHINIILLQRIFSEQLHDYVIRSTVLNTTLQGPVHHLIVDSYYQEYILIITETHIVLFLAKEINNVNSTLKPEPIRQCTNKKFEYSNHFISGCFVMGPHLERKESNERCEELFLCILTSIDLLIYSIPHLEHVGSYRLPSTVSQFGVIIPFIACDRDNQYGDYILLSERGSQSVSILSTVCAPLYIQRHQICSLDLVLLSPAIAHPSSMYAISITSTGILLCTLPDFQVISLKSCKYRTESRYRIYFDILGAYFVICELIYKTNLSKLVFYEFGTGNIAYSIERHGIITQLIYIDDTHGLLLDDKGYTYTFSYTDTMIAVVAGMVECMKGCKGSVSRLWASLDDVEWDTESNNSSMSC